jgi:hypothetical protein
MKPSEMLDQCKKQIELAGEGAIVIFKIPGKWGKRGTKKLFGNRGPIGKIVASSQDTLIVAFNAQEVMTAVTSLLEVERIS